MEENQNNQTLPEEHENNSQTLQPQDDWKQVLPEDLRGAVEFDGVEGVEQMARQFVANKRAMTGDFEPATEEQAVEYFKRAGAPDTLDGYDRLPDVPEDNQEMRELENVLINGAYAAHLTKKQYMQMRDSLFDQWRAEAEKSAIADQGKTIAAQKQMREEFGAAYESKISDFAYLTEVTGLKEWAAANGADKDPVFIKALLKIGENYIEPTGAPIGNRHTSVSDLNAQINTLMASPAYMDKNHPQHNDVVNQAFMLRKKINGEV